MSVKTIKSVVVEALNGKYVYELAIVDLKKMLKGKARDVVRSTLLPIFAEWYGVGLVEGSGKAEGTLVLDSGAEHYEGCRKALSRMVSEIAPIEVKPKKSLRIAKEVRASALEFLAQFDSVSEAIAVLKQVA